MSLAKKILTAAFALLLLQITSGFSNAEDWRGFRGETGDGAALAGTTVPTEFSDTKNIKWKVEVPGAGASSPIIVGDKVILTCYTGYGISRDEVGEMDNLKRHVICYSRTDGKKLWQKDFEPYLPEDPFSGMGVPEHGYTSSTPVSDGKNVYVFFGKSGVVALDLEGNELWKTSLGTGSGKMKWGSGASPVLADDVLIVNATDESKSVVGLDKNTGKELWRNEGLENIWGTPLVVDQNGEKTVVISVPLEVWGMDPETGKLDWYVTNGVSDNSVSTSPVLSGDTVIAMGGRSGASVAVKLGGKKGADVTDTNTVWKGKAVTRIMTPVVSGGYLFGSSRGIMTCVDAKTGKEVYKERIPSNGGSSSKSKQQWRW